MVPIKRYADRLCRETFHVIDQTTAERISSISDSDKDGMRDCPAIKEHSSVFGRVFYDFARRARLPLCISNRQLFTPTSCQIEPRYFTYTHSTRSICMCAFVLLFSLILYLHAISSYSPQLLLSYYAF